MDLTPNLIEHDLKALGVTDHMKWSYVLGYKEWLIIPLRYRNVLEYTFKILFKSMVYMFDGHALQHFRRCREATTGSEM